MGGLLQGGLHIRQPVGQKGQLLDQRRPQNAHKGDEKQNYPITAEGLTVTDEEGNAVQEAKAEFCFADLPTRTVENVIVWRGDRIAGTVNVTVRAKNAEAAAQLQALQAEQTFEYKS